MIIPIDQMIENMIHLEKGETLSEMRFGFLQKNQGLLFHKKEKKRGALFFL